MVKTYTPVESRLVREWVTREYPTSLQWKKVRVGELPKGVDPSYSGILRRWADLIFKVDRTVYIVEAKMRPDPGAIGQLMLYANLFPKTPEFSEFRGLDVKLVFLTTINDNAVRALAKENNVEFIVFSPAWAKEYWDTLAQKAI